MRDAFVLVALGVAVGVPAALALGRVVRAQLYGLKANDVPTMIAAIAGLGLIDCLAGYVPAFRASRVDPMVALRYE